MAKEKFLVLAVTRYNFKDEGSGKTMEGGHIHFLPDYVYSESEKKGILPAKMTLPLLALDDAFGNVYPAFCNLDIRSLPNGKGVLQPKLVAMEYISKADIFASNKS